MRVLLIEDDPATAKFIELALMAENFSTYTAELGKEGLDLGKLYDYDVILLGSKSSGYVRVRRSSDPTLF